MSFTSIISSVVNVDPQRSRSVGTYVPGLCGTCLGPTFPTTHSNNSLPSLQLSEREDALKLKRPGDRLCALARLGFVHDCARILDESSNSEDVINFQSTLDGVMRTPLHSCCTAFNVHVSVAILLDTPIPVLLKFKSLLWLPHAYITTNM